MAKNIKGRKFVATAATAALVASAIVPVASAADFGDQSKISAWAADAVKHAVEKGYMQGTGGNFTPQGTVTKAQVAQVIYNALGLKAGAPAKFSDVPAGQWYTDAVNALAEKGIATGTEKGTFEPNKNVTLAEAAQMLSKALEIKGTADLSKFADASAVPTWANEAIQALVSNGYIKGGEVNGKLSLDPLGNLTRERLATMFVNIAKGELEEVVAPDTTATKVASVASTNLKQVVVTFDGTVDEATATDEENYSINGLTVQSASLSEDGKSVTLTVTTQFSNQVEYKLSFSNVKAGTKEISVTEYKFTPVDAALPTVANVTALGNQTLSVTFSEPIKSANTSNFTVDGKVVVGDVKVSGKTAIVKLYSALEDGEHTVAVKDVLDYANFKSLNSEHQFTVVKDDTAPTLSSVVKATFEKVQIKFSEIVDPATVTATSAYWLQGTSKKYPKSVTQISGDTFEFDFSDNRIQYATDLYVTGVKDYSSNTIAADSKIQVNPVIDQTRPEVSNLTYDAATKSFTVKFNKALDKTTAEKAANYVVKNSAGTVVSKFKTASLNSANNKEVTVQLVDGLSAGASYTVEVAGVSDNTTLKNVMLPYTKTITVGDVSTPDFSSVVRNTSNNTLVVNFSKKMAVSGDGSIVEKAKYLYQTTGGSWKTLPAGASVNVSPDGKSAIIQFSLSDVNVNDITKLRVQLVKDDKGNYLTDLTQEHTVDNQTAVTYVGAVATDNNKVAVEFSRALLSNTVNVNDFTVNAGSTTLNVISASLNSTGKKVILTLADSNLLNDNATFGNGSLPVTVDVRTNATTSTVDGTRINSGSQTVSDQISAKIVSLSSIATGHGINVTFGESLSPTLTSVETDFIIEGKDGVLVPGTDYTVAIGAASNILSINFTVASGLKEKNAVYTVSLNPRFLKDASLNLVDALAKDDAIDVYVADKTAPAAPTLAQLTVGATTVTATTSDAEVGAKIVVVAEGASATSTPIVTATVGANGEINLTGLTASTAYDIYVIDAAGNVSTKVDITTAAAAAL